MEIVWCFFIFIFRFFCPFFVGFSHICDILQEMIHLSTLRHIRRLIASAVIFGSAVLLMLWLPIQILKVVWFSFLPYTLSGDSEVNELSLQLLLLQVKYLMKNISVLFIYFFNENINFKLFLDNSTRIFRAKSYTHLVERCNTCVVLRGILDIRHQKLFIGC